MKNKQYYAMAGAGAGLFVVLTLCAFGRALIPRPEGFFDIAGGVKLAFICLGVLLGTVVAMVAAACAE